VRDRIIMSDEMREALRVRLQVLRDSITTSMQCAIIDDIASILDVALDETDPRRPKTVGPR
jgi:hypothetical protein